MVVEAEVLGRLQDYLEDPVEEELVADKVLEVPIKEVFQL
jgi:hypothetical protein